MKNTLLINLNDILSYTTVSGNLDETSISPHIFNAQILYLEPMLGTDLYDKLIELVDTDDINTTGYTNYKTLLDTYVIPVVVFNTLALFIPINSFKVTDGGVYQNQATNANTSEIDKIDSITQRYKIIGAKYEKKLVAYLCKNSTLFEEYTSNDGLVKKSETTQRSGFYLGTNNIYSKIKR